jgi:hypothetical protein
MNDRYDDFSAAITVCDINGVILSMNPEAARAFQKDGGLGLIGKSLFDCHSPDSNTIIRRLIDEEASNVYTVESSGKRKLVYQSPWYRTLPSAERTIGGLIEMVIPLPPEMKNIVRG